MHQAFACKQSISEQDSVEKHFERTPSPAPAEVLWPTFQTREHFWGAETSNRVMQEAEANSK